VGPDYGIVGPRGVGYVELCEFLEARYRFRQVFEENSVEGEGEVEDEE
jgi:hypothetical protein